MLDRAYRLESDMGWMSFGEHGAGGGTWIMAPKLCHACWSPRLFESHFLDVSGGTGILLIEVSQGLYCSV